MKRKRFSRSSQKTRDTISHDALVALDDRYQTRRRINILLKRDHSFRCYFQTGNFLAKCRQQTPWLVVSTIDDFVLCPLTALIAFLDLTIFYYSISNIPSSASFFSSEMCVEKLPFSSKIDDNAS